ncbi:MAG TPA: four helix bundle protein [Ignavibacteriaceae bacterium]|jgi:four helix bundle protein|nr:four helix bundle protein [Ignavibacteriaceae bacterium]
MRTHKDLIVYRKSIDFVTLVYQITKQFPKEELYSLANQMRRAAISIPSNISEGAARNHNKEFIQFLYIALGSASEIETQILISYNLKYISEEDFKVMDNLIIEIRKLINGLIKSIK